MEFLDFAALVQSRRSVRRYRDEPVPDDLLMSAVQLATWAPNGGNRQPWQFWIIKNQQVIAAMADAVDARSRLMASWPAPPHLQATAERWVRKGAFFRHAPVCIAALVGAYLSPADQLLAARGPQDPQALEMIEWRRWGASRIQTVAGAIMTLLLGLHQQGLGACWMAGPQQAKAEIEQILGVPSGFEFLALVPVGWPAETVEAGPRKPTSETIRFIR